MDLTGLAEGINVAREAEGRAAPRSVPEQPGAPWSCFPERARRVGQVRRPGVHSGEVEWGASCFQGRGVGGWLGARVWSFRAPPGWA